MVDAVSQIRLVRKGADDKQTVQRIINRLYLELGRAETKFPGWPDDVVHGVAVAQEEMGEAVQAALDLYYGRGSKGKLQHELEQTAAMCIRMLFYLEKNKDELL